MRTIARRVGKTVLVIALLYGFMVLGAALWLRRSLTPENLAASRGCWGERDSMAKDARSQWRRDSLMLYILRLSPAAPEHHGPGPNWRLVPAEYVYLTWWPIAERNRLFAETAPHVPRCPPWKPDKV